MSRCSATITAGFIDLATFDEIEKYLYDSDDAVTYFVRDTKKSTWFTQIPVTLSKTSGVGEFGGSLGAQVSRAGDYLLHAWLNATIPAVALVAPAEGEDQGTLRWTENLGHNLIKCATLEFNDLVAHKFDNFWLDFWSAFTVPASKREGYDQMIAANTTPAASLAAVELNVPLPFFFAHDSGVALPTAALPYNDMRVNIEFRDWTELLVYQTGAQLANVNERENTTPVTASVLTNGAPKLTANVVSNYAITSNYERSQMGKAPRDIVVLQTQVAPQYNFTSTSGAIPFDVRFSHALKCLFWGVRNKTHSAVWSNYGAESYVSAADGSISTVPVSDPLLSTQLVYENTTRVDMNSSYYSLVNPWYHAVSIPQKPGYHMYSYALDLVNLDAQGSTNFGKLTNVSLNLEPDTTAITAASTNVAQTYQTVILCANHNVVRISGGALGFPVL